MKKKILALCLSIVMLLVCFPVTATTPGTSTPLDTEAGVTNEQASANDISTSEEYTTKTIEFVSDEIIGNVEEIPALREENVKHFRLSNGSYEAVSFASAIHRKDKNGVWQDIDNSLTLKSVNDKKGYYTEDSRVSFANTFKFGSELFSLNENGYAISMLPISSGKITTGEMQLSLATAPIVTNAQKRTESKIFDSVESAIQFDNKTSIVYNDIRANTDIEYILDGNDIKENIIVKAKSDSYEYIFQLNLTGLTAELDQAGNILLRDAKTENVKYTIPAPYMYDNNGECSYDVNYTLQAASSEKYLLMISASAEWINDESREFPVTIDPTIQGSIWVDTYIDSENPNVSYATSEALYASNTKTALIKPYIPSLPMNISRIDSAELYVSYYGAEADFNIGLYEVVGMIDTNTTYSNKPNISTTKLSEQTVSSSIPTLQTINFPITTIFSNWYYSGAIAYGVAIKNSSGTQDTVAIKSSETVDSPYLRVVYTQQIPDGVYAIKNVAGQSYLTNYNYVGVAGGELCHIEREASPANTYSESSLFKISGSNGLYIIRLMGNNNLTITISNGKVITKEIASRDEDVPDTDKFSITVRNNGYIIAPYNSPDIIVIDTDVDCELTTAPMSSAITDSMRWTFEQYTGEHRTSVSLKRLERWDTTGIVKGESEVVTSIVSSTYVNEHIFDIEVTQGFENLVEVDWDETENAGTITAINFGRIFLDVNLLRNDGTVEYTGCFIFVIIPAEGTYYIRNVGTGRYAEVAGPSTSQRVVIQQGQFTTADYSKWLVEHVEGEGGYVRLKSPYSNLYISITSHNEFTVRQFAANDYNLWLIQTTGEGTVKLINKATADTDLVLAVPLDENDNGTDLTQIEYTSDTNYRDEWKMYSVLPYTVNLEVIYDQAYATRYADASTRISSQILALQEKYLTEFGLIIECSSPTIFSSYADTACENAYNELCTHGEDYECINSSMSHTPVLQTLHHKNLYNILARIQLPDTSKTLKIAYIGHEMCVKNGSTHTSNSSYGVAYSDYGFAAVMNFEAEPSKSTKTLIHEFGHFYGERLDHYDIGDVPSTTELNEQIGWELYNRNCIYGENKELPTVLTNYAICNGCKAKIYSEINKYNH